MASQEQNHPLRASPATSAGSIGLLKLAVIAPVAFLLLVMFQQSGVTHQAPTTAFAETGAPTLGDVSCNGSVDSVDSLHILRSVAGLSTSAGCLDEAGDVDCNSAVNSVDALRILRYVAGLSNTTPEGCMPVGGPLGALTPQVLAAWLYAAPNDEARYQALLKVMELLSIGVYTSQGGEVQQGAERGPGDFYLYDFELRMLAASLGRRDTAWGVQQIADTLDQVGYREDGQPFTADDLNQIIHDATVDSLATPDEASSLIPLLVRELGLRHETPYDLADELDVDEARFDALQMTLILVGLTLPVIAEEGPLDTPASTLIAGSNGILTAQPLGVPSACGDFKDEGSDLWAPAKYFLTAVKAVGTIAKVATGFIDIGHGSVLAFSVQVKAIEDDSEGPTHYDHGPGDPGRNLNFRIEVRMLDDLGETLVECGWLATADFPPEGPISGVLVQFNPFASGLENHGTLDCEGLLCSKTTDGYGIATLTFDPKSETEPYGQGIEALSTGSLEAIAWYQSAFKNIFGTLAQFVTPKADVFAWGVRHHGCAFEIPLQSSLAAGAAQPLAASAALPCAYEGTASATSVWGGLTWTATASDLRFELQPPGGPLDGRYELVRGNVTVVGSGGRADCTLSGSFSIPEPINDGVHEFFGYIIVDAERSKYSAAGSAADDEGHLSHCSPRQLDGQYGLSWLSMTGDPGERPFTPGGALEGSNDYTDPFYGISVHSQWSLHPGECNPSPEPVCQ